MRKIVFVTGGAGYIGSHTVVDLCLAGYTPIILDDFRNSKAFILDRIEQITGEKIIHFNVNCQDETAVMQVFAQYPNAVGVIHFAADKAVGESVQNPIKYYQNNIGSLCVVLKCMEAFGISNLVFSSSCTVYGETSDPVVTELSPVKESASPYGDTKISSEKIIQYTINASANLKASLLRYFNPIGAHPSGLIGELPQGVPNNLLPYITQTAKGIREKLIVFGNDYNTPDGTNIRDYIHVMDLANAHVMALEFLINAPPKTCDILNLGSGKGTSVLEIIQAFMAVNEVSLNYEIGPRRAGDVEQIYANANKAKQVLNWKCLYSLEDALKHAWAWEKSLLSKDFE